VKRFEVVFLDMDGVLCNFIAAAHAVHGRDYVHEEYPRGCWEIAEHWGVTVDHFWDGIDQHPTFWNDLHAYPWMDELIGLARKYGETVKLLTSPSRSPHCFSGKRAWCDANVPRDIELIICKSKHLLATPNRLLIDDGDHNVEPWLYTGSPALLFPQPWNAGYVYRNDPMKYVREWLAGCPEAAA